MGKGGCETGKEICETQLIRWEEVRKHTSRNDSWIVIGDGVYDVSRWMYKHPGGARIINHFAGQDATEAWQAMHIDQKYVTKFLKSLYIGKLRDESKDDKKKVIQQDFEELRKQSYKNNWFKPNPLFYIFHLAHIVALDGLAVWLLYYFGNSWTVWILCSLVLATAQAQAGWTQHDYGHRSVFGNTKMNQFFHQLVIGFLKAASSHWWNFRHFQHHVKPNVIRKDPDIALPMIFLFGETMAKRWAEMKKGFMPYNYQHNYFWILGPPLLLPVYFHYEVIFFTFKHRDWIDISVIMANFFCFGYIFSHFMSGWAVFALYMTMRFFESIWFVMVTQMSHIPMVVEHEQDLDWLTSQTIATCNVKPSLFNDWFTGHLNYQIEHHLFPTMPRHNYIKVQPLVKELCKKHGLPYTEKELLPAFLDITRSLKKSGEIWAEAYFG